MDFKPAHSGYEAFNVGEDLSANPHDTGTPEAEEWEAGWLRAQAEEDDANA